MRHVFPRPRRPFALSPKNARDRPQRCPLRDLVFAERLRFNRGMSARELSKIAQSPESMALELLARAAILEHYLAELASGVAAARQAGAIFGKLEQLMKTFQEELDRLTKSVEGITGVVPSVVATLGDLAGKFKANANDPTRIGELADQLDEAKTKIANAVATGTKAADEAPAPAPAEEPKPAEQPTSEATDPKPAEGEQPA